MSTTLEEAVATETGVGGEAEVETLAPPNADGAGQGRIVDPADYDDPELALPKVDGESIDRIAFTFAGTVFLDRSDPNDVKLYRALKLGHDVTLMVEGKCLGTGAKGATNRDGELDVVLGSKRVKVTSVYRPAAEDLAAELTKVGVANPETLDDEDEAA